MLPYYYTDLELNGILLASSIDKCSTNDCKEYMALNGWTLRKSRKVIDEDRMVRHNGMIKKINNFSGYEVGIAKDDKTYFSLMESESNALLVCILMVIRYQ